MGRFDNARPCCSWIDAPVHSFASGEGDGEGGEGLRSLSTATRASSTVSAIVRRGVNVWCFEKREQQAQLTSGRGTDSAQPDHNKNTPFSRFSFRPTLVCTKIMVPTSHHHPSCRRRSSAIVNMCTRLGSKTGFVKILGTASAHVWNRGQYSLIYARLNVLFLVPDKRIPCAISVPRQASREQAPYQSHRRQSRAGPSPEASRPPPIQT